jgi:pentatricopeptide repeat protein
VIQAWALTETEAGALRAQEWLERMHTEYLEGNEQMKPDSAAVATAIAAWSRSGARDAVKQAWKLFQRLGDYVEFDKIHVINSLLTCFSRSKRIDGNQMALQLFNDLLEHSTEKNSAKPLPDSTSYLIVLSALATLGRPEEAEIILQRMKEEYHTGHTSSKITNSHCTAVVSALAKSDRIDKVDKIRSFLTQMEDWSISMNDESLKPSLATYNAFLSCFANGNVPFAGSEAEKVLRTMKTYAAAGQLQYTPDRVSYTSVINCLARYGLSERAVSVLGEMHTDFSNGNASASPDLQTYNTVLASFAKEKRNKNAIAHAVQFFGKMKQLAATGFIAKLDVVSYATLMNVYAHSPHRHKDKIFTAQCSENLLREMQAAYKEDGGIRPNHVAYNTCINCWANAGRPDRAGEILQEMVQDYQTGNSRARPDVTSFNTTMKAFAFARRPDSGKRAEEILERMKDLHNSGALKVRPDAVTYSTLILCYALTKQAKSLERAEEILRHMDELYNTGELDQGATKQAFEAICKGWSVCRDVSGSERMQVLQNEMRLRFGSAPLPSTRDRYARK